ncbi:MAG: hypothetical protein WD757_02590 [Actinomycetota bacterium]
MTSVSLRSTRGLPLAAFVLILVVAIASVIVVGTSNPEAQMFVVVTALTFGIGAIVIPRVAARDGTLSPQFLFFALAAHVFGSLVRYFIIQSVYHGVADANGYMGLGAEYAAQFRAWNFPPIPPAGTEFMGYLVGVLFAITGPTMLGGFVVCSTLSFIGSWYFYKAFRLSFARGNTRMYALLIFLLPSMWYWPSSLGKDAVIVLFLGLATYGFALVFRMVIVKGLFISMIGIGGVLMIRPPVGAALALSAAIAFAIRPAKLKIPALRAANWILLVTLLAGLSVIAIGASKSFAGDSTLVEAYEAQRTSDFGLGGSDSNFQASSIISPTGIPNALITSNFRPFPWEASGVLPRIAAMEGALLIVLIVARAREILRGIKSWRDNSMVILVLGSFTGISLVLSSLTNYGLLARQRTQVLPFLLMLPAMVRARPKVEVSQRQEAHQPVRLFA